MILNPTQRIIMPLKIIDLILGSKYFSNTEHDLWYFDVLLNIFNFPKGTIVSVQFIIYKSVQNSTSWYKFPQSSVSQEEFDKRPKSSWEYSLIVDELYS